MPIRRYEFTAKSLPGSAREDGFNLIDPPPCVPSRRVYPLAGIIHGGQDSGMGLHFVPITEAMAQEALTWRYPPPYDFYDPPIGVTDEQLRALLSQESPQYGVFDDADRLIGLIGTGPDAQVPGGDYSAPAVDLGIGLHPDHCGRGLGREVVAGFIAFLEARDGPSTYRATIAAFNQRSLKTFTHLGFTETSSFQTGPPDSPVDWVILTSAIPKLRSARKTPEHP